jgi:hypothetical protein
VSTPANGVGDPAVMDMSQLFGTQTPAPTPEDKKEEAQISYTKSKGWQTQKDYLQERINYWQHFLPGNTPVNQMTAEQRDMAWVVADNMIREINLWITHAEAPANSSTEQ